MHCNWPFFYLFAHVKLAHFSDISIPDAVAQGAVFLLHGQIVVAHAVHAVGLRPIFEDIFAKVCVADPLHLHLITPGSWIRLLVGTLLVYGVAFSEDLKGKKDKTEQCEQ